MVAAIQKRSVTVAGRVIHLAPTDIIGEGGEAEIYRISATTALKLFKPHRLGAYDQKLINLPSRFTPSVVAPLEICRDGNQRIVGYTMELIPNPYHLRELFNRDFRCQSGISSEMAIDIFRSLHAALRDLHAAGIVVGDFNSLNVLVKQSNVHLIDADSMQWGRFYCDSFTPRYTDPLICDPAAQNISLIHPHSEKTDWYAFALMLFESLLFVHPFAGVYKPGSGQKPCPPDLRPLQRISVFNPNVIYPSAAMPFQQLPREVLDYFMAALIDDERVPFPFYLFDLLEGKMPTAVYPTPTAALAATSSGAGMRIRKLFQTKGVILKLDVQSDRIRYLYHEDGKFLRDGQKALMTGDLDHSMSFVLSGETTAVTRAAQTFILSADAAKPLPVELYRDFQAVIASSGIETYWVAGGELWCNDGNGNLHIDSVISKQTRLWVGKTFGLAFAQAGQLRRVFLFSERAGRIPVELPNFDGRIVDIKCHFGQEVVWLLVQVESARKSLSCLCFCIDKGGSLIATAQAEDSADSWLKFETGKCAAAFQDDQGNPVETLLVATTPGVAQVRTSGPRSRSGTASGQLEVTRIYTVPDLPIESMQLAISPDGLIAYDNQNIYVVTSN